MKSAKIELDDVIYYIPNENLAALYEKAWTLRLMRLHLMSISEFAINRRTNEILKCRV